MKNANRAVYIALVLLLLTAVLTARLVRGGAGPRGTSGENSEFHIRSGDDSIAAVSLQELLEMQTEDFTAVFATSITKPRETGLRGVELSVILDSLGIGTEGAGHFSVSGLDGYYSYLTADEVKKPQNVYICFAMDGEMLKPTARAVWVRLCW